MDQKEILAKLQKSIEEMDTELAEKSAKEAVEAGIDPLAAISDGLSKGMETMSALFDDGEVFVPQLLVASEAFENAVAILTSTMSEEMKNSISQGTVLVHTVQGDIHDIGKNIVKTMLAASGFKVIDMGRDVAVEDVIEKAKEYKVDIIAGSALMTTTMPSQRDIISLLKEEGIRDQFICMFGGAPVSEEWVKKIGADGYSESASGAVKKAIELMSKKRG